MTIYQLLCLIGVPTLFLSIIGYLINRVKKTAEDTKAVKLGVQAMLRALMISEYNKWSDRGYAPIYARENFQNCWEHYHSLGANGVMDDIHKKFFDLPTDPPEEVE